MLFRASENTTDSREYIFEELRRSSKNFFSNYKELSNQARQMEELYGEYSLASDDYFEKLRQSESTFKELNNTYAKLLEIYQEQLQTLINIFKKNEFKG